VVGGRQRLPLGHSVARRGALRLREGAVPEALHVLALQGLHDVVLGTGAQASTRRESVSAGLEILDHIARLKVKVLHRQRTQSWSFKCTAHDGRARYWTAVCSEAGVKSKRRQLYFFTASTTFDKLTLEGAKQPRTRLTC
jgi:hypothetical protein